MNEHEVESVLRRWYRAEVGDDVVASPVLQRRIGSIWVTAPSRFHTGDRRLLMVAAALVISTVLLATIAAFGSDLIRLPVALIPRPVAPTPTVAPTPSAAPSFVTGGTLTAFEEPLGGSCLPPLPGGVALQLVVEPPESNGELADPDVVVVTDDGTVLSGKRGQLRLGEGIRQRHLTAAGIEALGRAVTEAQLHNCQGVPLGPPYERASLTVGLEAVELAVVGGVRQRTYRPTQEGEVTAMTLLIERLLDLDSWIEPAGWSDSDWSPYMPASWRVMVQLDFAAAGACKTGVSLSPPDFSQCAPWAHLTMPDGTPLLAFGAYYPRLNYPSGAYNPSYRCALIGEQAAAEVVEAFRLEPGDEPGTYNAHWDYGGTQIDTTNGTVMLELRGLLPGDQGCERPLTGHQGTPPMDMAPSIAPCSIIEGTVDPSLLTQYFQGGQLTGPGWWTGCAVEHSRAGLGAFVRGRETSAADGASYATSLFGAGVEIEQVLGRTIFWNDCFDLDARCTPAAAVVSPPHVVVFYWYGEQPRAELNAVIESALRQRLIP